MVFFRAHFFSGTCGTILLWILFIVNVGHVDFCNQYMKLTLKNIYCIPFDMHQMNGCKFSILEHKFYFLPPFRETMIEGLHNAVRTHTCTILPPPAWFPFCMAQNGKKTLHAFWEIYQFCCNFNINLANNGLKLHFCTLNDPIFGSPVHIKKIPFSWNPHPMTPFFQQNLTPNAPYFCSPLGTCTSFWYLSAPIPVIMYDTILHSIIYFCCIL